MKVQHMVSRQPSRRYGGTVAPLIVAGTLFAIVLGVVCYWGVCSTSSQIEAPTTANVDSTPVNNSEVPDASALETPKIEKEVVANNDIDSVANQQITNQQIIEPKSQPELIQTVEATTEIKLASAEQPSRESLVQDRLEAGEFGPAMTIARAETDQKKRTLLLQKIARHQMKAGEFNGALSAIRRISTSPEQTAVHNEYTRELSLSGGGAQANFGPLMALIQSVTDGLWEDDGEGGGTITPYRTGVFVDPNGLLQTLSKSEKTNRLKQLGLHARKADLNEDMAKSSELRLVSLSRLEKEIARQQKAGKPVLETMKQLAGLSQIKYVFISPEQNDVIIGGPAEAWKYNSEGIPMGVESGRPTLQLDDFVTVLRTFSKGGNQAFQCLIVPRKESMKKVQEYASSSRSKGALSSKNSVRNFVKQIEKRLGEQDVVFEGIPRNSRVARVILDADYKMKLIGIDRLEKGGIQSYFDLLTPELQKSGPSNTALRWWLTMKYESVLHSDNHDVFEIRGASVLCQSENEFITKKGERVHTGKAEPINRAFADGFTNKYAELCKEDFAFADLQNIFDLSLVAALLNNERLEGRLEWNSGLFANGKEYQTKKFAEVRTVPSAVNFRIYKGRDIVVQAAGGVKGDLNSVIANKKVFKQESRLGNLSTTGKAPQLPAGRWWWDASSK